MNKLTEEMGTLGKIAKLEELCGKLLGALNFTISILQKLADEGSELAKAALQSLDESEVKEE